MKAYYVKHSPDAGRVFSFLGLKKRKVKLFIFMFVLLVSVMTNFSKYVKTSEIITSLTSSISSSISNLGFTGNGLEEEMNESYSFFNIRRSFGGIDLDRVYELDREDFESLVLDSLPKTLRPKLARFLPMAMKYSEKYQIDPFWVLAVMWTESHFNPHARSYVDAQGLMQIMPATGHYLSKVMNRPVSKEMALTLIKEPEINIEMGVFYLRRLLKRFRHNYRLATVAYNMGPYGVSSRLKRRLPVGVKNQYLDRVRRSYKNLTKKFIAEMSEKPKVYQLTYVVRRRYYRGDQQKSYHHDLDGHLSKLIAWNNKFRYRQPVSIVL